MASLKHFFQRSARPGEAAAEPSTAAGGGISAAWTPRSARVAIAASMPRASLSSRYFARKDSASGRRGPMSSSSSSSEGEGDGQCEGEREGEGEAVAGA